MSKKLSVIVGGALVVIGALFAFLYNPDKTPPPKPPVVRPAKTAVVQEGGQLLQRSFTGVVQAADQVDLSFRIDGPLIDLPAKAGAQVKAGDVVAQIDPRDFKNKLKEVQGSLAGARAELEKMRTGEREENIRMLTNQLAAAKLEYENAVIEEKRWLQLYEGGVESKSRYDKRRLEMEIAKEKYDAAKQDLARGKKGARQEDLDAQEARIEALVQQETAAQNRLDDTTLKAPFSGRIAKRYVENFQDVRAKARIVSLQNIATIKVVADIPVSVMAMIREEYIEKLSVTFDLPDSPEFPVELTEVDVQADSRSQTYAVTVSLTPPKQYTILPGMSSSLRLYLNDKFQNSGGGIPVPADAIFNDAEGQSFVWVVKEPELTVRRVAVAMGDVSGDNVFVKSGLSGGERVVTAGVNFLAEGQKIRLLKQSN
jgi:multidrug efflux system membrane fusion protein